MRFCYFLKEENAICANASFSVTNLRNRGGDFVLKKDKIIPSTCVFVKMAQSLSNSR